MITFGKSDNLKLTLNLVGSPLFSSSAYKGISPRGNRTRNFSSSLEFLLIELRDDKYGWELRLYTWSEGCSIDSLRNFLSYDDEKAKFVILNENIKLGSHKADFNILLNNDNTLNKNIIKILRKTKLFTIMHKYFIYLFYFLLHRYHFNKQKKINKH